DAAHTQFRVHYRHVVLAHPGRAGIMEGGGRRLLDVSEQICVVHVTRARRDLLDTNLLQSGSAGDAASDAKASHDSLDILFVGQMIEEYLRLLPHVRREDADMTPALGAAGIQGEAEARLLGKVIACLAWRIRQEV